MNFGDFKKYLREGQRREDMIGVPRGTAGAVMTTSVQQQVAEDEDKQKLAKTFLKVNLAQHDKTYHKGGYKDGDVCNFRAALKRGDSADAIAAAEKKEGNVKVGFVKYKEDEKTGKKEIIGIEEAEKVEVNGGEGGKVEVAGIENGVNGIGNGEQGTEDEGTSEGARKGWLTRKQAMAEWEKLSQKQSQLSMYGVHAAQRGDDDEVAHWDKKCKEHQDEMDRLAKEYNLFSEDAQDKMPVSLAEHDERFHPDGYREGDACKVREAMGRGDSADRIEAAEGREAVERERGESDVAAYEVLSMPIYVGRWKDGRQVDRKDLPRVQSMLDKFMLKHPEIAAVNEDAAYDLENAVGRTPGWHRNDAKADTAEVWCDDDVDMVVEELLDTPDGRTRDLFDCFYPESHFDDEEAERGRDEAYQQAVRLAVNWAFHDDPLVWAKADAAARNWAYTAKNGHIVNMGAMAEAVQRLIGAAAEDVARGNDPVERYLAAK